MEKKRGKGRPSVTQRIAGSNAAFYESVITSGKGYRSRRSVSDTVYMYTAARVLSEAASEIEDLEVICGPEYMCRSILNQLGRMFRTEGYSETLEEEDKVKKLQRSIHIGFRVTEEEQAMIRRQMKNAGVSSLRAYLLKMAVNGYIVNIDLADVRECSRLLRIVGNNVNQLARHANAGGNIYPADITDIQTRLDGIWNQQNKIIRELSNILEAA